MSRTHHHRGQKHRHAAEEPCGTSVIQLELEKVIEEFDKRIKNLNDLHWDGTDDFYSQGVKDGIIDAKEKCERLMEVVTRVYSESGLEDIQEQ